MEVSAIKGEPFVNVFFYLLASLVETKHRIKALEEELKMKDKKIISLIKEHKMEVSAIKGEPFVTILVSNPQSTQFYEG